MASAPCQSRWHQNPIHWHWKRRTVWPPERCSFWEVVNQILLRFDTSWVTDIINELHHSWFEVCLSTAICRRFEMLMTSLAINDIVITHSNSRQSKFEDYRLDKLSWKAPHTMKVTFNFFTAEILALNLWMIQNWYAHTREIRTGGLSPRL
jgi:hypothetical protein